MTPREIIEKKVFGFEEIRPVPYHIEIDPEVRQRLDAHNGGPEWHDRLVSYLEGGHRVGETGARQLPNGLVRNPFGYDYRSGSIMHVERLALPEPPLDGFDWPEAESLADWDLLHRGFDASPAFRHCGMIYGFFERVSFMRGMENLLMDMVENPQFVHDLMDVYAVKAKVAGKMVLIGGLGTQQMLPRGTPDEVAAETRRLCDKMGAGGGYILGPAKPLMSDVPTENAVAFIEATLDQQIVSG